MKKYEKLKRNEKDKLNSYLLYTLHYSIVLSAIAVCSYILGATVVMIIILSQALNQAILFMYGLVLIAGLLFLFLVVRIANRKCKENCKRLFGIEKEEEIFK